MKVRILRHGAIAALLLLIFLLAAWAGGEGLAADRQAIALAADARDGSPILSRLAAAVTMAGGAAFTLPLALLSTLYLLYRRRPVTALVLAVTVLAERALVDGLKSGFARERPGDGELLIGSMAFPSGHSANSMTVFLLVALLAAPARHRGPAVIAAIMLSLAVGFTRILLGVHWPTDVLGGWMLGMGSALLAFAIARRLAPRDFEAKHDVVGGHRNAAGRDEPA